MTNHTYNLKVQSSPVPEGQELYVPAQMQVFPTTPLEVDAGLSPGLRLHHHHASIVGNMQMNGQVGRKHTIPPSRARPAPFQMTFYTGARL